jgi:heptosyltransferase-1
MNFSSPSSILIIKTSSLGDIVCSLPVLTELRRIYPKAYIGWVVDHRFADLLAGHPWIDELFVFKHLKVRFGKGAWGQVRRALEELRDLELRLRTRPWDVAIDLQSVFKSSCILRRSGARLRIAEFAGLRHLPSLFAANHWVFARRQHEVQRCLEVAAPLKVRTDAPRFCLFVDDAAAQWASQRLACLMPPRLIVAPGSARPEKRWAPQYFADAIACAKKAKAVFSTVIVGAAPDREAASLIERETGTDCVNLAGHTTLKQLAAVLAEGDIMLSGDTGPMHMMAALGKPVVAVFGPTDPMANGPWGDNHIVLRGRAGRVTGVSPEEAGRAVADLLRRSHARG